MIARLAWFVIRRVGKNRISVWLALALLVTWVGGTNDPNCTMATNHLAVAAHFFNRCSYFHHFLQYQAAYVAAWLPRPTTIRWSKFDVQLLSLVPANTGNPLKPSRYSGWLFSSSRRTDATSGALVAAP